MNTEGKRKFIINVIFIAIVLLIAYILFKYAINFLMPFLIAYMVAVLLHPVALFFEKKLKFKSKFAVIFTVVVFYCTVGVLIFAVGAGFFDYVRTQFAKLPGFYTNTVQPLLSMALDGAIVFPEGFDPTLASAIESVFENLFSYVGSLVSTLSGAIVSLISNLASSLPTFIIAVVFCLVSTFYFTLDYDSVHVFLKRQLNEEHYEKVEAVKSAVRDILGGYLKSYAIILGITFVELSIAMLIMRVDNFLMVALMIAIFDILPVVGTGTVLIPWTVIELVRGNYGMMIGLIVTYVVIFIVRQVIEPKIVGDRVGLHPLVTIISMFVGTVLFGVIGLFGIPITMAIIVDLKKKGIIEFFK